MPAALTLRAPRDLPGLGPIRIRALEKAGFRSLSLLRDATLEQLLAVPGMSDPKARHIQTVLANAILVEETIAREAIVEAAIVAAAPALRNVTPGNANNSVYDLAANTSDSPAAEFFPTPARFSKDHDDFKRGALTSGSAFLDTRAGDEANETPMPAPLPTGVSLWEREAERARQDIVALLTCPPAPNFRARLLRELVRFAAGMPVWKAALAQAGDKDQERALRRLRRLQDSLMETRVQQDIDRKTQARLAEDLAEASDRLYALSGQPEPARRTEDTHD